MSFPNPVDVAKIAALLRKNEGWYETIDEAYELLIKSDEYCKAQQSKKLGKEKRSLKNKVLISLFIKRLTDY